MTRFLSLYSGMLLVMLCLGVNTLPAHARPIEVRDVYTTDENFNNKIVFAPGDKINYHVDVDNTTGSTFPIDVRFQVFTAFNLDPTYYGYDQTIHVDQMPVGLTRFYTPTTLPSDARIYSDYILRIIVTESPCSGVDCNEDYGENRFAIQKTVPLPREPQGTAPNLIVLVHGCCTDANGVRNEWDRLGNKIVQETIKNQPPGAWEIVVWDWSYDTPNFGLDFQNAALKAYENALFQGLDLANAISNHPYEHVHLIGHSAGAKLIQVAAEELILRYKEIQNNEERPFIHLTFLDAYTPFKMDEDTYGFLANYPNHYSEHYVDRTPAAPFTNAILPNAFNFNITRWKPHLDPLNDPIGHQWPRNWYEESVTSTSPQFKYGYPLSLEGGHDQFDQLGTLYPAGKKCPLTKAEDLCVPK